MVPKGIKRNMVGHFVFYEVPMQSLESKPFKTFEEQLNILKTRGLIIDDDEKAIAVLKRISYYRLSAYSLTLRKDDIFYDDVRIENIVELYDFDAALRNLILRNTEHIEMAFRTYISYHHAEEYGNIGYRNPKTFNDSYFHQKFIAKLEKQIEKSDEIFVKHYKEKENGIFPFWVAIETINFDTLSKLYKNMLSPEKTTISKLYCRVHYEYVDSWLHSAVIARNICAHGGRLYNRIGLQAVKISKKKYPNVKNSSVFAYFIAIHKLLPSNKLKQQFKSDLESLFQKFPFADPKYMGFPNEWESYL